MAVPVIITAVEAAVEVLVLLVQLQRLQATEKAVPVVQDYRQALMERQLHAQAVEVLADYLQVLQRSLEAAARVDML
jgi:hypothetical protein